MGIHLRSVSCQKKCQFILGTVTDRLCGYEITVAIRVIGYVYPQLSFGVNYAFVPHIPMFS